MWRREDDNDGGYDGVCGEGDEAETVHHHGRKFPVDHDLVLFLSVPHGPGDVPQLPQDALQLSGVVEAEGGVRGDDGAPFLVGPAHEARAAAVVRGRARGGHGVDLSDVVVNVQDVGEQRLGRPFLQLQLPHLVVHHDGLARDLFPRAAHAQDPRQPLQQHTPNLTEQGGRHTCWSVHLVTPTEGRG